MIQRLADEWIGIYDRFVVGHPNLWIDFEKTLIGKPSYIRHVIPWGASLCYVLMVHLFPGIQRKYKLLMGYPRLIKVIMFCWNGMLCLFSISVFSVCILEGFWALHHYNWNVYNMLICLPECSFWGPRPMANFGYMFTWSKFFELGDTFFLILKNPEKKVVLLHWYHHFSVLLFTWYAVMVHYSIGYIATTMNSLIHFALYYYYAVATTGRKMWWGRYLTMAQTIQMVFGIMAIIAWVIGWKWFDMDCCCDNILLIGVIGFFVYSSYLYLFIDYYIKRWQVGKEKKKEGKEKKKEGKEKKKEGKEKKKEGKEEKQETRN